MDWIPPYVSRHTAMLEKELGKAKTKELRAKIKYETAQAYTRICEENYNKAKGQDEPDKKG